MELGTFFFTVGVVSAVRRFGASALQDVSACAATKFKSLEAFAGASSVCAAADKVLDLTRPSAGKPSAVCGYLVSP